MTISGGMKTETSEQLGLRMAELQIFTHPLLMGPMANRSDRTTSQCYVDQTPGAH